jgi:tight adherence protein B
VRSARQQLCLITFDAVPSVFLHPTSNRRLSSTVLTSTPPTGAGANVPAAATVALKELANARVALGAIVVISDGAGSLTSPTGPTPVTVQKTAAAVHVPIFTVGLQDSASSAATLSALRSAAPGSFVAATPTGLPNVLKQISASLDHGYVLRYQSHQPAGRPVSVAVSAHGLSGAVTLHYRAPQPQSNPARHAAPPAHPRHRVKAFSGSTLLSPVPSFASSGANHHTASFWASSRSLLVVALISGLLFTLALVLAFYRPARRSVRVRVGSFIPEAEAAEPEVVLDRSSRRIATPRLLERSTWWAPFVEDVEIGRNPHDPVYLVKRAAIFGVVVALLIAVLSGSPLLAVLPLLLWPVALRMLVSRQARKQREVFADTLPGYLQDLASAMRVGRSFAGSLAVVAESADEPVRGELERTVTDEQLGRPLDESLGAVAVRMESGDIDQVALIASLNRRSGSNVAEALDRVADGARERADMRREVKALTAQAKMSSWVLTALPPLLLLGINVIAPEYAYPLLHTPVGIVLLVVAALMVLGGWKVMKKITTIKA